MKNKTAAQLSRTIHLVLTIQWGLHLPAVILLYIFANDLWAKISILYLALVSIYANMATHWGAYQSSRAEDKADPETE